MAKKVVPGYAKDFKNHNVLVFDDNNMVTEFRVYSVDSDAIETEDHIFKVADTVKVYNSSNGGFTYLVNAPSIAIQEAEHLKLLRRNKTIKNLFSYETEKSLDLMKILPYIIAIVAVIF